MYIFTDIGHMTLTFPIGHHLRRISNRSQTDSLLPLQNIKPTLSNLIPLLYYSTSNTLSRPQLSLLPQRQPTHNHHHPKPPHHHHHHQPTNQPTNPPKCSSPPSSPPPPRRPTQNPNPHPPPRPPPNLNPNPPAPPATNSTPRSPNSGHPKRTSSCSSAAWPFSHSASTARGEP